MFETTEILKLVDNHLVSLAEMDNKESCFRDFIISISIKGVRRRIGLAYEINQNWDDYIAENQSIALFWTTFVNPLFSVHKDIQ
jgi:hypothetical protein